MRIKSSDVTSTRYLMFRVAMEDDQVDEGDLLVTDDEVGWRYDCGGETDSCGFPLKWVSLCRICHLL